MLIMPPHAVIHIIKLHCMKDGIFDSYQPTLSHYEVLVTIYIYILVLVKYFMNNKNCLHKLHLVVVYYLFPEYHYSL